MTYSSPSISFVCPCPVALARLSTKLRLTNIVMVSGHHNGEWDRYLSGYVTPIHVEHWRCDRLTDADSAGLWSWGSYSQHSLRGGSDKFHSSESIPNVSTTPPLRNNELY
jgi:hypothetical protein